MDVDEEMPPLPPEVKINMKLDDIIKYEKMKAGVSHNLQFKFGGGRKFRGESRKFRGEGRKFRPYFKPRYRSQNWRLGCNGPNTPRFRRYQSGYQRMGRLRAFLERKWKTTPMNSVFQRLGRNPLLESAKAKVWNARNYYRPIRPHFSFLKRFNLKHDRHDPNRAKKLSQSYQYYSSKMGDGLGDMINNCNESTLDEVKIEKLSEAIGGQVTRVEREELEAGIVVTTITSQVPTANDTMNNSFNDRTMINPYYDGSVANSNYSFANRVWNRPAMPFFATNPMNRLNGYGSVMSDNGSVMSDNTYNMQPESYASSMSNGSNLNPNAFNQNVFNQNAFNQNGMNHNAMNHNAMNHNAINHDGLNRNGLNFGVHGSNGLSRTVNLSGEQRRQAIQNLNVPRESNQPREAIGNFGRGINENVYVQSTNQPINSRFGGSSSISVISSQSS
ncbi:uncharacterized protein LOC117641832 [Thrips palmi]|uniref:Uncharacterized protein LOC117641832 n=1 Tax=Thrips palmi TaxID=161013 RepID=A0A6P8Y6X0_THRPL|nr:uncharacterized protein LOC117641832 [Thrips palmi]